MSLLSLEPWDDSDVEGPSRSQEHVTIGSSWMFQAPEYVNTRCPALASWMEMENHVTTFFEISYIYR